MINRRSFIISTLALISSGLLGCNKGNGKNIQKKDSTIMRRQTPLNTLDWKSFLRSWSDDILSLLKDNNPLQASELEKEVLTTGYLGFAPATGNEIEKTEKRLGVSLPPSYKNFLRVSNGWRQIAMDAGDGLLFPVTKINWFKDMYPDSLSDWLSATGGSMDASDKEYFVYGEKQDPVIFRDSNLKECLAISEEIDAAIYLLNPRVVDANGEWESWFFGYKLPGANRYQSFQEMMQAEEIRVKRNLTDAIEYWRSIKNKKA